MFPLDLFMLYNQQYLTVLGNPCISFQKLYLVCLMYYIYLLYMMRFFDTENFVIKTTYLHNILQKFVVNEVTVTHSLDRFARKLQAQHTGSNRILKRIAFSTIDLNIPQDLGINSIFSEKDLTLITPVILELPSLLLIHYESLFHLCHLVSK